MSLTPPRPTPVPLNALRAVEAAARHESFLRAAEELAVSPGAVAQQVRKLEDWAGVALFDRHPQGVVPTALARDVLAHLTTGFEHLSEAARTLRHARPRAPVRLAALPAVAQLWLAPRLTDLRAALPDVELSIHALDAPPNLTHGGFDMAIYPGAATRPGTRLLQRNLLCPVAAPHVAVRLHRPQDLAGAVLIHDSSWTNDWNRWLQANRVSGVVAAQGPVHSLYSLAVDRCVAGDGVLMGHLALLRGLIADGRLTPLFEDRAVDGPALCLTLPNGTDPDSLLVKVADALAAAGAGAA